MRKIITVGREFGSGGRELGRRIAEELKIAYYDHEIVSELIKRTSLAEEYVRNVEEKRPYPLLAITTGRTFWAEPNPIMEQQLSLIREQSDIIRELAEKSDCVIVGRCADYVLRDMNPLRLFVYADMDFKMARCRLRDGDHEKMSDRDLKKHIMSVDKNRAQYYEFVTDQKWGGRDNYDICLNTSIIDLKKAAALIADFADSAMAVPTNE